MALTDTAVRQAKPKDKGYTLADGDGLALFVHPRGGKVLASLSGKRTAIASR